MKIDAWKIAWLGQDRHMILCGKVQAKLMTVSGGCYLTMADLQILRTKLDQLAQTGVPPVSLGYLAGREEGATTPHILTVRFDQPSARKMVDLIDAHLLAVEGGNAELEPPPHPDLPVCAI